MADRANGGTTSCLGSLRKDAAQSVAWQRKAADLGYDLSQISLGIAYEAGWGAPKDLDQALFWFRKAANQGSLVA